MGDYNCPHCKKEIPIHGIWPGVKRVERNSCLGEWDAGSPPVAILSAAYFRYTGPAVKNKRK